MLLITIEVKDESLTVHDDKLKKSREVWRAAGLIVYVKGAMDKKQYEQARNLVMNYCENVHIPVISIKKTGNQNSFARSFETQTRRMF